MRTITYMKGGQVLTREVPDLTVQELAAIDARKVLIAKKRLQQEAVSERAALRTVAVDQLIKDGAVAADVKTYAAALDVISSAEARDAPSELPAKPASISKSK